MENKRNASKSQQDNGSRTTSKFQFTYNVCVGVEMNEWLLLIPDLYCNSEFFVVHGPFNSCRALITSKIILTPQLELAKVTNSEWNIIIDFRVVHDNVVVGLRTHESDLFQSMPIV